MMVKSMKARGFGSMAACFAAGAVCALLVGQASGPAMAQSKTKETTTKVVYSARYVNQVVATKATEQIREVYEFPNAPVFLVRTRTAIGVWLREERGLRMLMEVKLDESFQSLVFLDDNRTFVVQTDKRVRVYSLNKELVVEEVTGSR